MMRRHWLLVQVALVGVLAAFALPSSSSALLAQIPIYLTATGASPSVQRLPAGQASVRWVNQDTVAHTVTFANSACSMQIAPGDSGTCSNLFPGPAGDYAYSVDGTGQASIEVIAMARNVTLLASSHTIHRGSELRLHGDLAVAQTSPPIVEGPLQPVIVLARHDRRHPFHRIAVVTARAHRPRNLANAHSVWQLRVRPRASTIYIVEANFQPPGGQYWQRAWSKPFRLRVGR